MQCFNCPSVPAGSAERHHLCGMVDVAVFTIIEREEKALLWFLQLEDITVHWLPTSQQFKYGTLTNTHGQKIRVAVLGTRYVGNTSMATLTALAQSALLPRLSVLVGIAAGLKSGKLVEGTQERSISGVKIGTVLVPREIVDYSFAAIKRVEDLAVEVPMHRQHPVERVGLTIGKNITHEERAELIRCRDNYMLLEENKQWTGRLDRASFPAPDGVAVDQWMRSLITNVVEPTEFIQTDDDVASSNLLLKNEEVLQKLHAHRHPRVKAGEMEAAGFAVACRACNAEWFVIRAVSDLGDSQKIDLFQPYACANAAGYLVAVLKRLDLNLVRNGAADSLHKHLLSKAEVSIKLVLESFAAIFNDQLSRKVNLEIYWIGEAKVRTKGGTRSVPGVIRHGTMKAERSGFLNRFEPHRFFPFVPTEGTARAVAQAADPSDVRDEVLYFIPPEDKTPLKWVYAVPLFQDTHEGKQRTGALCCTSTDSLYDANATPEEVYRAKISLKAMIGSVRDVVTAACVASGAFDLVLREVTLDGNS